MGEPSSAIHTRVEKAHAIQRERFKQTGDLCQERLIRVRPYRSMRILKLARTIADLAESEFIETQHLAEAVQYWAQSREEQNGACI